MAATPETVYAVQPLTVFKAAAACYDSTGTLVGNSAPVTYLGSRSFVIPAGVIEFFSDKMLPSAFGLSSFPIGGFIDYRHVYTLPIGLASPTSGQTYDASQTWNLADGWTDDIDGTGVMVAGSTNASGGAITFPNYAVADNLPAGFNTLLIIGDSIDYRQDDIGGLGFIYDGGGVKKRAAKARNLPYMCMAQGGRTWGMQSTSNLCAQIYRRFNCADISLGTNDIAFATTLNTISANVDAVLSRLRSAGHIWIGVQTIPPRTNEDGDITNANNLYACTDQSHQTAYYTQARVANGFASDGYGFGAGETRDQYNTVTLPAKLSGGSIDSLFEFAFYCQDGTTTWKWKAPTLSTTLHAAISANATSCSLNATPTQFDNLVFEPGISNIDVGSQGGPHAWSITGSGPYVVSLQTMNSYTNSSNGILPAKAHTINTGVKNTFSPDGTHPSTLPILAALSAKTTQYSALA